MDEQMQAVLKSMPHLQQAQYGADDQLRELCVFAHRLGLYDAADLILKMLENKT